MLTHARKHVHTDTHTHTHTLTHRHTHTQTHPHTHTLPHTHTHTKHTLSHTHTHTHTHTHAHIIFSLSHKIVSRQTAGEREWPASPSCVWWPGCGSLRLPRPPVSPPRPVPHHRTPASWSATPPTVCRKRASWEGR